LKSKICELLEIEYPIIQGGMAWVSTSKLAAAVSNAGGLGIIAAGNAPAIWVENEINKVREETNKPFGVNIMLLSPYADEVVETVCKLKVPIVTTGAGNPSKYMDKFNASNIKVIPVIASVAMARKMENVGVHAIIAEGTESGGHIGDLTTMVLVPQVVDNVRIPVIAAGGIADARGVKAAFALGAVGVQVGTRFICSTECSVHENYKKAVLSAGDRDAIVTGRTTGHPVRSLKNNLTNAFLAEEKKFATPESLDLLGKGKLQLAALDGDVKMGAVMAGQSSGIIKDIKSCKEILKDLSLGIPEEYR
jgi:enoyl-[acyl-carrier protein] reductase II